MHDFFASLAPEPYRVLGVLLKPLSYGHVILLNRAGLEVVQNERDLALAVQICSRDYKSAFEYLNGIFTPIGQVALEEFAGQCVGKDKAEAFKAWCLYLEGHSSAPEYCPQEGSASDRGSPFLSQLRAWLLGHCNYSPETLMDAPFGQCLWDYGSSIEEHNGWGIVGDKHREIDRLLNN